jgi:lysophospholipid acyltransferase (LPLAT)-like uncharacterized protein
LICAAARRPTRYEKTVTKVLGWCVGMLVRMWALTWRIRVLLGPGVALAGPQRVVFAFFHGQQMALVRARQRSVATLVSWSADGELQTGAMSALGVSVVRGSSSRGGAAGLRALVRGLREGCHDLAFAVDGPRGPRGRSKPGAALAARRSGAALVPVASSASHRIVLASAWDRFEIPLPFARVVIVAGTPIDARAAESCPLLDAAIEQCRLRAESELGGGRATSSSCPSLR